MCLYQYYFWDAQALFRDFRLVRHVEMMCSHPTANKNWTNWNWKRFDSFFFVSVSLLNQSSLFKYMLNDCGRLFQVSKAKMINTTLKFLPQLFVNGESGNNFRSIELFHAMRRRKPTKLFLALPSTFYSKLFFLTCWICLVSLIMRYTVMNTAKAM